MSSPAARAASKPVWSADALQPHRHLNASRADSRMTALTLGRLSLVPVILLSFMKVPPVTTAAIVLFVVADIFDGMIARGSRADGPTRRALDSLVDRIGIDAGMVAAYIAGILPAPLLVALLARDAYCALICVRMVYRRNVVIKADWMYRALNLSVALGAIAAPFLSAGLWISLAGVMLLLSVVVAADLTRSVRFVESSPSGVRNVVLAAGALRQRTLRWAK